MKAFCIDLDGTLLRSDKTVSDVNKESIRKAINKGNKVFIVTGRPYCFSKYLAKEIHKDIEVISFNGAFYDKGKDIIINYISNEALIEAIDILKHSNCKSFFKGKNLFYTIEDYDDRFLYDNINDKVSDELKVKSYTNLSWDEIAHNAKDIIKILVYSYDKKEVDKISIKLQNIKGLTISSYMDISIDITSEDIHKGRAVKDVMNYYGINKSEIVAIGDSENDIPMLKEAGYSIAMGNAKEEIKEICNMITLSNDEDGVSYAIESIIN
ncbi:HAD family hydrolase [Clostridium sp. MSJ-4]|uniref:HAD family hydrolase n=1 Tax=Clostridium simiarum TaxID=2841506 RepID=A0ABS6F3G4_9CLOT|nr:HAD family hydrolase [Clostridium simiarum]MBU5593008.1 HAD family hydrolase [Clostridium simiarum]